MIDDAKIIQISQASTSGRPFIALKLEESDHAAHLLDNIEEMEAWFIATKIKEREKVLGLRGKPPFTSQKSFIRQAHKESGKAMGKLKDSLVSIGIGAHAADIRIQTYDTAIDAALDKFMARVPPGLTT